MRKSPCCSQGSRSSPIERNAGSQGHELANLAQALNGYLELASARTDDELAVRYLANARLAAQRICEMARSLQAAEE